ncbi:hypothetical protein B0J12DRAFT_693166 [Macrophomina phaseolina]|uniref:F-box domain cyclin-like protein n=1 Tax=Macrophomina phaseolina TaxID=35725 RepID=A0ABQ8GU08_9PEZI|nr:hypothetical protein B0J12DRAFT_693166 [Macrophomina phaseolina]
MSDEISSTGETRLSLLGLPAEIRNLIWEYTFPPANSRYTTLSRANSRPQSVKSRAPSPSSSTSSASSDSDSSFSSSSSSSRSTAVPADDEHDSTSSFNNGHTYNTAVRAAALGPHPSLALLLTCQQIRAETLLLAFSRTPFRTKLCRPAALTTRLAVLSPAQIRAVRSLTFTSAAASAAHMKQWEGDLRPLLFPVYVQCRKLLWEVVRLLPGVRFVDFVLGEERAGEFGKGGPGGSMVGRGGGRGRRTVGGAKFFFDTVVGVGLKERSGRGESHAWGDRWHVVPGEGEGEERCVWLVEDGQCDGDDEERRLIERDQGKRWVRVEIVRLPHGG